MEIKTAEFISSHDKMAKLPTDGKKELALIGRSNVGKSSLLNMMCGNKKLAKTSQSPGKTQTINHFLINEDWYLVDLPGYGYAKVSKTKREDWGKMIKNYLTKRETLQCVFVLIDVRHEPQKIDLEFVNWLGEQGIPLGILFTKSDKISKNQVYANIKKFQTAMLKNWEALPTMFQSSSVTTEGKEEILAYFAEIIYPKT